MLTKAPIATMLRVTDAATAVEFYRDQLGLDYAGQDPMGQEMFTLGNGTALVLMPEPDAQPSGRTELSFEVSDIADEISALEQRGVRFADYDLPELKTVDHICTIGSERAAWFEDPDGNVLCLHEVTG